MIHYQVEQDGLSEIVIGSGSFGEVYAATLTVSPYLSRDVVVKEPYTDKATLDSIVNEAKITMYLESTGCVPICYGLLKNEEDGYGIVMEYVGSGQTLYDIMCESDMPRLIWLNIVCQLSSGLNKIHKKDVLINDIKSDNILVDMSGTLPVVKFCDMGTASYKSGVHYKGAMEGCVHLAPEACAHAETTPACDVFSLGRVLKKIHGVSHISALLAVSDMCMAENPADRPTLSTVVQRLQDEYTKEVLFPTLTLTVPSHRYLESSDEESEEESTGHVGVNTPINVDTSSPSSPEVNGAVSSDTESRRDNLRSTRSGEVSPSNNKDPAMMLSVKETDTSLGFVNWAETKDSVSISKNHTLCRHDSVSSYGHATDARNMDTGIVFSTETKHISAATSKPTQDGSSSPINNTDAQSLHKMEIDNGCC
ncbi:probable serine/threonine-protein kinase DDB_G0275165 [Haliotis rubra]|uniref:probable serine/threonine-protein kinase DDB_G0275165 n=1 Tax=Haliotis rubra TaxID=36100 RepID=UPI001EE5FF24|nr:probable serine/threonine-protein kinase DDB_G0275165 [Haliotis rubra]